MYLVIAHVNARPDRRDDLAALLSTLAVASRAEDGCLDYRFTADIEDVNSFFSIERWTDRAALEAHLSTPELAQALGVLGELVSGPPSITGHEVAGEPHEFG